MPDGQCKVCHEPLPAGNGGNDDGLCVACRVIILEEQQDMDVETEVDE